MPRPQAAERLSLVPRGTALGHLQEAGVLQQVMSAMAQPDRDPRQEVLLTGLQEDVDGGWQPGAGQLQVVADRPTFLEVKASLPGPGLLVVRDSFMAGWEATVNGDAATILRADLAWRAVVLPAGEHAVRLTFRQPGLMAGAGCSAGGVVLALGLQVMGWRRRQGDAL